LIELDSIVLHVPGIAFDSDREGVRYWRTESGDMLGLWYFPIPPDLAAPPNEIDKLRATYRRGVAAVGMAIVSVDATKVDGRAAVRTIFKGRIPEEGSFGAMYVASITVPFRDFSFVLKTICEERGTTGVRDAVVADILMKQGKVGLGPSGFTGWFADPYDPGFRAAVLRNLSDDEQYDAMFADHPLSRARRLLRTLEERIKISAEAKAAPGLTGPEKPRTWRFWKH